MLAWTIYISFMGAAVLLLLPRGNARLARIVALLTAVGWFRLRAGRGVPGRTRQTQTITQVPWIPSLGIEYHLAADGISLTLVLLTGHRGHRRDSILLEHRASGEGVLRLLPRAHWRGLWRVPQLRSVPAVRLLRAGHHPKVLPHRHLGFDPEGIWRDEAGAVFVCRQRDGAHRFDRGLRRGRGQDHEPAELAQFPFPQSFQWWAFPLVFVGFGILAGLWPFHTWAPTGHVAAPTAASMLLAGVVMKLGAYGCLRVAMTLFPARAGRLGFPRAGLRFLARRVQPAGGHRHRLWRDGRAGAEGLQIRHRLFQREPHGFRAAGIDDAEPGRLERRRAANVLARHHRRPAVRRGRADGL